jgi:TetR/AcrR family fatty acid metabolism transcriptional regulator
MAGRQAGKRQAILEAAGKVFAASGYEGSSIRDIARAAGVADGTIYNYFESKQALAEALVDGLVAALAEAESRPLGLDDADGLAGRVHRRMAALQGGYGALAAVLPVILASPERRERFRQEFIGPVLAQLTGELGGETAALRARLLLSAVLGFQVLMLLGDPATREAWEDQEALAALWSGVIAAVAGSA